MVRVTCMRCHRSYALTNEQIMRAVEESHGTKHKHFVVSCPYCRTPAKVPLRSIHQAYARLEKLGLWTAAPATEGRVTVSDEALALETDAEGETKNPVRREES
ncbi:MAG: hypothetical protein RML36_03790 [Anaerolineae bacterium]|nr:hypothetical protein [Anaerolineae bacterium]MDW8098592.1 hypothetical protein [Anaerolineae bacterium]